MIEINVVGAPYECSSCARAQQTDAMTKPRPLSAKALFTPCDPRQFDFRTTAELADIETLTGQQRALEAVAFGIEIRKHGFNVFALGPSGTGKLTSILEMVETRAANEPVPCDWCYVNNFDDPRKPIALSLPAGRGASLRHDMAQLVEEMATAVPAAFENEDTHARLEEIEEEFRERRTAALAELRAQAESKGIAVFETPVGFSFAPIGRNNAILSPEQFGKLSEAEQSRIQGEVSALQERLQKLLRQFQIWRRESRQKVKDLQREIAQFAVGHLIEALCQTYSDLPEVLAYLAAVRDDLVGHVSDFLSQPEQPATIAGLLGGATPFQRYTVNLLVGHDGDAGAPVVCESLPSHANLVGRTEHKAQMGTLVTDFTLIKAGALHRANGGYLVLDAEKVLLQPFAWESLKRVLESKEIKIESLEQALSLVSTVAVEPQPIPLDVKVVLVGDRLLYYLLQEYDPEFCDLFKVAADFEADMDRSPDTSEAYARLVATVARRNDLRPLRRNAVCRVVEHAARMTGDSRKLSTHLRSLADLMSEADHWAGRAKRAAISRDDVQRAIDEQERRSSRLRERYREAILRDTILIATEGEVPGQVNGLSIIQLGDYAFSHPSRITATTRLGEGEIVDIEREIELGGPIHSKGVLILSSFLTSRYGKNHPVSLSASLVFEQSYGGVDGDSASLAELCALLSALSGLPIKQPIAMTGSVNQLGQVQPIGGVNEKIEGYFDICRARGLNGEHAVIIPSTNVKDLMLHADVVAAVRAKQFRVFAVATVDEAIELLTGVRAGAPDAQGRFPARSVNARVNERLVEMATIRRTHSEKGHGEEDHAGDGD